MWVLPARDGTVIGGTLIRQEYYGAILSIIQWMQAAKGAARIYVSQISCCTSSSLFQLFPSDDCDNIKIEEEELNLWDVHSPYAMPFRENN